MLGIEPEIVLFGLAVGVLIGLTGIGGGSLMTPLLIMVLGVAPVTAIGTDLAYGAVTKTFGGASHLRKGTVDLTIAGWLGAGSVPGTILGVVLVSRLHAAYGQSFDQVLLACLAGALVVVAAITIVRALLLTQLATRERIGTLRLSGAGKLGAVALGFALGAILGLTSVGSGALIGVAMLLIFRLTPQRVAGTSVFLGAALLWVAGIGYIIGGNVDFSLMGSILIGSIPGVWLGSHFVDRVPDQALRVTLAAVLLGSALAMVSKAGAALPAAAIIGAPLAVGLLGYLLHRSGIRPAPPSRRPQAPSTAATPKAAAAALPTSTSRLRAPEH